MSNRHMSTRARRSIGILAAAAATTALAAGTSIADPPETGCPAGYDRLEVAWFEEQGPYKLPRMYDSDGNNNGFVCASPLPDSVRDNWCRQGDANACRLQELGLPVYRFKEDDNAAAEHP